MLKQIFISRFKKTARETFLFAKDKVKVRVAQGTVRGCLETLPNGRNYQRFSGIPYAQKPIGDLKFRAPKKLHKFETDELDCTREGQKCFQKSTVTRKFIGSEDCLHLNVYAPADPDSSSKKAVMVFIHGGGFMFDSNSADL
jgi:cholinesterase